MCPYREDLRRNFSYVGPEEGRGQHAVKTAEAVLMCEAGVQ